MKQLKQVCFEDFSLLPCYTGFLSHQTSLVLCAIPREEEGLWVIQEN